MSSRNNRKAPTRKSGVSKKTKSSRRATGIVDAHAHCYPPEIFADPVRWAKAHGENHWAALVGPRPDGKPPLQGWATRDEMLRAMDEAGVERCVLLGWYWENHETCVWHNAAMAEWVRASPVRFSAFACVQPLAGQAALDDLCRARDAGLCGVGEVFPAAQGFSMDEPWWERVLAWAKAEKLPVNMHVPEPAGRDYPGRIGAPLSDYQKLAREHPGVTFIFAHWGGLLPLFMLNPSVRRDLHNVYFDTSASPLICDKTIYRLAANVVGAERILFGSDYPLRVFPREQRHPDFKRPVAEVRSSGLTKSEQAFVLGGNMNKLLGL